MKDKLHIYYSMLFGAFGGLNGWFISSLFLRGAGENQSLRHQAVYGAILGAMIGLSVTGYDGLIARSIKRFSRLGGAGMLSGAAAGALALALAQAAYQRLLVEDLPGFALKPLIIGTVCWIALGAVIGLGETLRKGTQHWKGLAGGAIGGLIGGSLHEAARQIGGGAPEQFFLAVSLTALGGAIGASVSLIAAILRNAWVEALDGKLAGRIFDLTKFVANASASRLQGVIGSDEWKCHVYLPGDNAVLPHHARIGLLNGAPFLTVLAKASKPGITLVNGAAVTACPLRDGDKLRIGATTLVYREKRGRR